MTVLLFQEEKLLDATVDICSDIIPRVVWVVLLVLIPILKNTAGVMDLLCPYQTRYRSSNFMIVRSKCNVRVSRWDKTDTSPLSGRTLAKA